MFTNTIKEKFMDKSKPAGMDVKVKFGVKSFITVVGILLAVLIVVGVLTYVIPAGKYTIYTTDIEKAEEPFYQFTTDKSLDKQIVPDSYRELVPLNSAINGEKIQSAQCSLDLFSLGKSSR